MRKSDKKIENHIIKVLTQVCQSALEDIDGFEWLTHTVNFEKFPESLKIVCIFDSNIKLANYIKSANNQDLAALITDSLADIGIQLKEPKNQIELDSEENCMLYHAGNWRKRLS
ncbi:Fis family transcriptional regulator [Colwellia sp. BRX10-3]|uniref:Fis family transcriptional regulator n=1 Tax=Colwellia sp. BRX10-3 TaxID=2759844 RepID=UPI0015F5E20D|nr:Fis family transcriptional regulator [Colwellia sp. BRX10-3]MBA6391907.1 Fis family transcriptional regulator [Colwellia sp. BRX10-3]